MKNYISAFCAVYYLSIALPLHAADINDLTYSVSNEFVTITGCDVSASGELSIPDTIEGKPVTRIGVAALRDCAGLTAVTIPASVTHLYSQAFRDCSGMTAVMIPESVVFIAESGFAGCSSLVTLTIPDSVTSIGAGAFYECSGITSLHIGTGLESIGQMVFQGCLALTEVIIPDNVTEIETYAFRNCSSVTNVQIGNGVSAIGNRAFFNCPLDTLTIGSGVTDIDDSAFAVSAGFHRIDEVVFLGNDAPSMGVNVFGTRGPFSIVVPTYATGWGVYRDAFEGVQLTSLAPFTYTVQDGNVTISGSSELYAGAVNIPDAIYGNPVTEIGNNCFKDRFRITEITLPDSLNSIGHSAFSNTSIESIEIPDGITDIPVNAFRECDDLISINLPDSITSVGNYAFMECSSLQSINIPDDVISIGLRAFYGCTVLETVNLGVSVSTIGNQAFYSVSISEITLPEGLTSIGSYAFFNCNQLGEIVIPEGVTHIKRNTFERCSTLSRVVLPESLSVIEDYAFTECALLSEINLEENIISIGQYAFQGCTSLSGIRVPGSAQNIGDQAFAECEDLRIVNLAGNLPVVAADAFANSPYVIVVTPDASAGDIIGGAPVLDVAAVGLHRPDEMAEKDAEIVSQAAQISELSQRPTLAEVQDARVGSILLSKDWQTGEVSLCFGLEKTDDFVSWEAFEGGTWSNVLNGEFKLSLPLGETKKWLRLKLTD